MQKKKNKKPVGRPTLYKPEYCKKIIEFFNRKPFETETSIEYYSDGQLKSKKIITIPCELPLFEKFAADIGVCRDTLDEWRNKHLEFSDAYKKSKLLQQNILVSNALTGNYNPVFSIFTAKNITPWRDKMNVEVSPDVGKFFTALGSIGVNDDNAKDK